MRVAATVAFAVLGGGCLPIGGTGGKVLTATGVVVGAVGVGIAYDADASRGEMMSAAVPGLVIAALGLFYWIDDSTSEPYHGPSPHEIEQGQQYQGMQRQQREAAWRLTQEAQQAARDGNCSRVIEIDPNVKAMDEELYTSTFITDIAIQRCTGSPVPGAR